MRILSYCLCESIWLLWIGISAAAVVLAGVMTYFRSALGQRLSARIQHSLRKQLFHHLQHLGLLFLLAIMLVP